jgi:MATE family multidrug resistance protein
MIFAKWSKPFKVFSSLAGVSLARCKALFALGWPISLQVSGELLALTCITYLLGLFGVSALASGQIVGQFTLMFVMITIGLSQAVSILVSQSIGAKKWVQMRQTSLAGLFIILMIAIVFAVCFIFMPERLIDLYLDIKHPTHTMVVMLGVQFMEVAAVYIIFDGVRNVMTATLRGMQDAKIPMRIGLICMWVLGIPLAALCGFVYPHGPVALRWGFTFGVVLGTIWLWVRYDRQIEVRAAQ